MLLVKILMRRRVRMMEKVVVQMKKRKLIPKPFLKLKSEGGNKNLNLRKRR